MWMQWRGCCVRRETLSFTSAQEPVRARVSLHFGERRLPNRCWKYARTNCCFRTLLASGLASLAVSSNHDGLMARGMVVEIFGSVLTETCLACNQRFRRRFAPVVLGRKCEECGGKLKKTGCRYGQAIYKPGLERAAEAAEKAEVALVLGSGMHTWPLAAGRDGLPMKAKRVVLVTLGETAADGHAAIERFDCTCDEFMRRLMSTLDIAVPPFVFEQRFAVKWMRDGNKINVYVSAADAAETLAFCEAGTVNGEELERSQMTYALSATVAELRVMLRPKDAFGKEALVTEIVLQTEGKNEGEAVACFSQTMPD